MGISIIKLRAIFKYLVLLLAFSYVSQAYGGWSQSMLAAAYRQPPALWPPMQTIEDSATELAALPPLPEVNWHTPATEKLGYQLFFDPRLSGSGQIACASCHDPDLGWADGRRVAIGHHRQPGPRNTMSILNAAYFQQLFWDGRAWGLVEQALAPITNPLEMHGDLDLVLARLNQIPGYKKAFNNAFGSKKITAEQLAFALAAFERRLVSRVNRLDKFIAGDYQALNNQEINGLHLYRTKAGCINCHQGALYSDARFHHTGLSYYGRHYHDIGMAEISQQVADRGKFRTPSLRDWSFTGPWMHNGLFPSIRGILNMYNAGMIGNSSLHPELPPLSPLIQPLALTSAELDALEAFLATLSRQPLRLALPVLSDFSPQP